MTYFLQLPHVILPSLTEDQAASEFLIQTPTVLISSDFLPSPPARMTALEVTLLPTVHFLEQAFAGADFSTEKFSAALSLISAALFQCPKIAKFSVAHFFKLSCDLRCSFSIAKSRKILRCSSSDI